MIEFVVLGFIIFWLMYIAYKLNKWVIKNEKRIMYYKFGYHFEDGKGWIK